MDPTLSNALAYQMEEEICMINLKRQDFKWKNQRKRNVVIMYHKLYNEPNTLKEAPLQGAKITKKRSFAC